MFFNEALTQADIDHFYGTDLGYAKAQTWLHLQRLPFHQIYLPQHC
jgi:hypothetical protein